MSSLEFVKTLYEMGAFAPLYRNDLDVDIAKVHHYVHNKHDVQNLVFSDNNTKLIREKERKRPQTKQIIYYAYFETCYNQELNQEVEFMLCIQNMERTDKRTFIGKECGKQLLEYLPNNSVVYFHNFGFDGCLLMKYGIKNNIMKCSKII